MEQVWRFRPGNIAAGNPSGILPVNKVSSLGTRGYRLYNMPPVYTKLFTGTTVDTINDLA